MSKKIDYNDVIHRIGFFRNKANLSAREIAEKAMKIAGEICIFTNGNLTIEEA